MHEMAESFERSVEIQTFSGDSYSKTFSFSTRNPVSALMRIYFRLNSIPPVTKNKVHVLRLDPEDLNYQVSDPAFALCHRMPF